MATTDRQTQFSGPSRDVLDKFLESTIECVLVVGGDMRIVSSNEAASRAFARGNEMIHGRRLTEVVRDAALHDAFRWTLEQARCSDLRLELVSGEKRKFDVHISPIELDDAKYTIGFFHDVTQIERLESIRQQFLSNISHELRTPLTSILAFVETLEDGAIDDRENNRRFVGVIRRNAERMRSLISDILELAMIESGNVSIDIHRVDLHMLVDEVITDFSPKASHRGIELINSVDKATMVRADRVRLEQMLTNLVDNAVKFNRENGQVNVSSVCENGRRGIIVSDTGEGILPEHIDRIFERFYRADRARSASEIGGTGLGLAIIKHLARLHGGEVSATSDLGKGSTFRIDLPE